MKQRTTGSAGILLGLVLVAPGAILLSNRLILHNVAYRASWAPHGLVVLGIFGVAIILAAGSSFVER